MNDKELTELRDLIDEVIYSSTKADAKPFLNQLKRQALGIKKNIDPYISGKLNEVIAYADEASGRVKNKEHWISCVEQSWYVFENGCKNT